MNVYIYIAVMALTTYLIRALPLVFLKKPIQSRFVRSFLHYVPGACLTAMTFPAILYATKHMLSGAVGLGVAVVLAVCNRSLLTVAAAGACAVFLTDFLIRCL